MSNYHPEVGINIPITDPSTTLLFADTHFDHANIIKYCGRPFASIFTMNEEILRQYQLAVPAHGATVIFLGDMAFGRGSRPPRYWLQALTSLRDVSFYYIKGSHDHDVHPTSHLPSGVVVCDGAYFSWGRYGFIATHVPTSQHIAAVRPGWWNIHGHTHSRNFVCPDKRAVCVGVEAIDYRPVSLQQVIDVVDAVENCYGSVSLQRVV